MAFNFNELNKSSFTINTKDFDYKSLADLFNDNGKDAVYTVRALYINDKGKYGDSAVCATDRDGGYFINLPRHIIDTVKVILANKQAIDAINNSECCLKIRPYYSTKYKKDCYGVEFLNADVIY